MAAGVESDIDEMWRTIIEVHNESKTLLLLCEELEPHEFRTFIQPYNELRHAYEHIVRSAANKFGINGGSADLDYQCRSMSKALGHEYRGFFDWADWLAIILREAISDTLKPYSTACIQASLPDYYSGDQLRIVEISEAIAQIRGDKDISRTEKIDQLAKDIITNGPSAKLDEVRKYKATLSELRDIHKRVLRAIPGLQGYAAREKRFRLVEWAAKLVIALLAGTAIFLAGRYLFPAAANHQNASSTQSVPSGALPLK